MLVAVLFEPVDEPRHHAADHLFCASGFIFAAASCRPRSAREFRRPAPRGAGAREQQLGIDAAGCLPFVELAQFFRIVGQRACAPRPGRPAPCRTGRARDRSAPVAASHRVGAVLLQPLGEPRDHAGRSMPSCWGAPCAAAPRRRAGLQRSAVLGAADFAASTPPSELGKFVRHRPPARLRASATAASLLSFWLSTRYERTSSQPALTSEPSFFSRAARRATMPSTSGVVFGRRAAALGPGTLRPRCRPLRRLPVQGVADDLHPRRTRRRFANSPRQIFSASARRPS